MSIAHDINFLRKDFLRAEKEPIVLTLFLATTLHIRIQCYSTLVFVHVAYQFNRSVSFTDPWMLLHPILYNIVVGPYHYIIK